MKFALVTGATSGIGLAIAESLLRDGCFVYMNYAHDSNRADSVMSRFSEFSTQMAFIQADLSEYPGIDEIAEVIQNSGNKLAYLVINFGMTDRTPFEEVDVRAWKRVMDSNVSIPFFLIQKLFTSSLFADDASILCISSLMASIPHSVSVSYGVSKAALSALCINLVKFLSPAGIRINAVEPGFVDTPWQKLKSPDQRARIEAKAALGRFAEAQEIADICLAALKNTYLTGAIIPVSGGYGQT